MIELIKLLLENDKILSTDDNFRDIEKKKKELSAYFKENYNWTLYSDRNLFKLKKIPSISEPYMASKFLKTKEEYSIYIALLISLEGYTQHNTFSFAQIFEKLKKHLKELIDLTWENRHTRYLLKNVFKFAEEHNILIKANFRENTDIEVDEENIDEVKVLYKKGEYCNYNYIVNNFDENIFHFKSIEDFEESQKNLPPKITLMRKLITKPVIYLKDLSSEEIELLKNKRFVRSVEDKLKSEIHIHRNEIFLFFKEQLIGDCFPSINNSADKLILILNNFLKEKVINNEVELRKDDTFIFEKEKLEEFLSNYKKENSSWITKNIINLKVDDLIKYMEEWKFLKEEDGKLIFYPAIGKITGYFKEEIIEDKIENKIETQKLF